MQSFDHLNTSLTGRKLIESSAGTGKTYAIASLYVRLLLERRLAVPEILVVTFTEAATGDLKRRIRDRIREAAEAFRLGVGKDEFLEGLLAKIPSRAEGEELLNAALRTLDEACIFTIHGFCQRILQENAFESASPFESEFTTTQDKLLREITDDFWRRELYGSSSLFVEFARDKKFEPAELYEFARKCLLSPFSRTIPETSRPDVARVEVAEAELIEEYQCLREDWRISRAAIWQIVVESDDVLKRSVYRRPTLQAACEDMDRFFAMGHPMSLPEDFTKFLPSSLEGAVKKNRLAPRHHFFEACQVFQQKHQTLLDLFEQKLLSLRVEFAGLVRRELRARKRQMNLRSFDDLLRDVYDALHGRWQSTLTKAIRRRYPAALIDEFQDTDPIQYAIFRCIYAEDDSTLFLIGDPKQAIYSFRGADIFAYLDAAGRIPARYTLDRNWRSSGHLVDAVNTLFLSTPDPFVARSISFYRVQAARPEAADEFLWNGHPDKAPLKLWFMERPAGQANKLLTKAEASEVLPEAVATDIVALLEAGKAHKALIKGQPVSAEDIAVLVRTNREAQLVQAALRKRKVPCVLYSDDSVFVSREAEELQRILAAIAEPGFEGEVRAALASDILGVGGLELEALASNDLAWEERLKAFLNYRDLWAEEGLMSMASALMTREQVRSRLLRYPDGERRLTNLLQCFELLHQAALEGKLGLESVLTWLAEARSDLKGVTAEERQIRLETDEKAVKIVTIHKSKGLEYGITYCPFCWNPAWSAGSVATFHDAQDRITVIQDVGSGNFSENLQQARLESFAENVRLLYVALTRARYRCTAVWGAFNGAGGSALAYLLHRPEELDPERLVQQLEAHFNSLDDSAIRQGLADLVGKSGGCIIVQPVPAATGRSYVPSLSGFDSLTCRTLGRAIPQDRGLSSFTSLVSGKARAPELPDHDPVWASVEPVEFESTASARAVTFFDFPRGTRAGTVVHKILEELDFSGARLEQNQRLIRDKLAEFGFDTLWLEALLQMAEKVLATPLLEDQPHLLLSRIRPPERLHELAFTLPLDLLTARRLRAVYTVHGGPDVPANFAEAIEKLAFLPVRGAMKGFIDLVFCCQGRFYLLDWKSNYLGGRSGDYGPQQLQAAMARELYLLQSHLYTVALHRYLSVRLPGYRYDTHFGGVFYLFLRGIDPEKGSRYGIYYDLPGEQLIRDLSQCLHAQRS